jgi:hypothetical protein
MKTLEQKLATAERCYRRNLLLADGCRGFGAPEKVRRYERAAERAWIRVDSLRYQIEQRTWETAMGMRGYAGSPAEREDRTTR